MSTTTGFDPASVPDGPHTAVPSESDAGVDLQLVQDTRNQIRALVQEMTELSNSDVSLGEFYDGLLSRIISALAATGGAVWALQDDGRIDLAFRVNIEAAELHGANAARHSLLLKRVASDGQPLAAPPRSGFADNHEAGNPTDFLLLLSPITIDRQVVGVIEVLQRPGAGPTTQRGYLRFLSQMSELAGNFLRNYRLRQYAERESLWRKLDQFLSELHRSLDLQATAYSLVNEARLVVDCDRVSLALKNGPRSQLVAVSGLDNIDRRAEEATRLARLSDAILATKEEFWFEGDTSSLAPQIEVLLQDYIDKSHGKAIGIVPLQSPGDAQTSETIGAIIFQQMADSRWSGSHKQRIATVAHFAAPALAHALEHDRVFLRSLWTWLGTWRKKLDTNLRRKLAAGAGAIAAVFLALAIIPTRFDIAARGELQPSQRWDIFAPEQGTVVTLPVRHGQQVKAGDLLAELSNTEIEVQLTELLGRQRVAQEQLEACRRAMLDSGRGGRARLSAGEENRLGGEILQLRQTLAGLEHEIELMRQKQANLTLRAEHSGEVVTWQVEQQLLRRPVQPGQTLMTIVDPQGPWELELRLPERRLKHVDAAVLACGDKPLQVTFMLSTMPGAEFTGEVVEIERAAEVRGEEGNTVLVRVAFDKEKLPLLRSDTTVTAKLHCGYGSLGYVWFGDLIEAAQTGVLFWL